VNPQPRLLVVGPHRLQLAVLFPSVMPRSDERLAIIMSPYGGPTTSGWWGPRGPSQWISTLLTRDSAWWWRTAGEPAGAGRLGTDRLWAIWVMRRRGPGCRA